jgi:hypothetical protein
MGSLSIQNSGTSTFRLGYEILLATPSKTLISKHAVPHLKKSVILKS